MRAAVYVRMSTQEQDDSPERQLEQILPYCERKHYRVVGTYQDLAMRGYDDARPEFARLLHDAQARKFDVIVMDEQSRLTRNDHIDYFEFVVGPLRRAKVQLDTVAKGIYDWTDVGQSIVQVVDQHSASSEIVTLSRRIVTKLAIQALRGEVFAGKPPYGYELVWVDACGNVVHKGKRNWSGRRPEGVRPTLAPKDAEAATVTWLFERYSLGNAVSALMKELYERGTPSPRGHDYWSRTHIRNVLTNRTYLGDYIFNRETAGRFHRLGWESGHGIAVPKAKPEEKPGKKLPKVVVTNNPECDWVVRANAHPALVSRELFDAVGTAMKGNRERRSPNQDRGDYVLAKLLMCSHCGSWMTGDISLSRKGERVRVYNCGGYCKSGPAKCRPYRVREADMLRVVERVVQDHFFSPELMDGLRAKAMAEGESLKTGKRLNKLHKDLAALEQKISRSTENILLLDPSLVPHAQKQLKAWEVERAAKAAEAALVAKENPVEDAEKLIAHIEQWAKALGEAMEKGDRQLLREALRNSIVKIEVRFRTEKKTVRSRYFLDGGVAHLCSGQSVVITAV